MNRRDLEVEHFITECQKLADALAMSDFNSASIRCYDAMIEMIRLRSPEAQAARHAAFVKRIA